MLRTVGGSFRYGYDVMSGSAEGFCGYPKLESIGGDLLIKRCSSGFSGSLTGGGTLSILDAQGSLGSYRLTGHRKVYSVGGDLVLDKDDDSRGPDSTQRLLEQLTTLGGTVILK